MALFRFENRLYPVSRVSLEDINHKGELNLMLLIELEGDQSIALRGSLNDSVQVTHLLRSTKYILACIEKDLPLVEAGDKIISIAKRNKIEVTLELTHSVSINTEGIFIKMPNETPRCRESYIFVGAEKFNVKFAVILSQRGAELHLYVEGNKTYMPTLIIYYKGGHYNSGILQGVKDSASTMAQVFQELLFQNSLQGYINFDRVVSEFVGNGNISDLDFFEVTTKKIKSLGWNILTILIINGKTYYFEIILNTVIKR